MKPKLIKSANGCKIIINKHGQAPMLFLEFIERLEFIFDFKIETIPNVDDVLSDNFEISFNQAPENIIEDCFNYINANC